MTAVTPVVLGGSLFTEAGSMTTLGISPLHRAAAFALSRRGGRAFRELMLTLNGATSGSAAAYSRYQIQAEADPANYGGRETIETVAELARNTAAADKARIDAEILAFSRHNTAFPLNGDRNPRGVAGGN